MIATLENHHQVNSQETLKTAEFQHDYQFASHTLSRRLGIDAFSALTASLAVAPVVTIIDTAVTQAAFGEKTVSESIRYTSRKLLFQPHNFVSSRPFLVILLLYFSTFATANSVKTLSDVYSLPAASSLVAVTFVNGTLSLFKDSQFAKTFVSTGTSGAIRRSPLKIGVLGPWLMRDFITLSATFSLPSILSSNFGLPLPIAQIMGPVLSQPIVAPLHLIGLDSYNRPERTSVLDRWKRVRGVWTPVSLAKMGRVLPGLGIGNVLNSMVKTELSV